MKRELEAEAAATAVEYKNTNVEARSTLINLINSICPEIPGVFNFIILVIWVFWLLQGSNVPVKEAACFSVSGVYFICPLTGETLKKSERETHIKEAILLVGLFTQTSSSNIPCTGTTGYIRNFFFCRVSLRIQWRLLL